MCRKSVPGGSSRTPGLDEVGDLPAAAPEWSRQVVPAIQDEAALPPIFERENELAILIHVPNPLRAIPRLSQRLTTSVGRRPIGRAHDRENLARSHASTKRERHVWLRRPGLRSVSRLVIFRDAVKEDCEPDHH